MKVRDNSLSHTQIHRSIHTEKSRCENAHKHPYINNCLYKQTLCTRETNPLPACYVNDEFWETHTHPKTRTSVENPGFCIVT